MNTERERAAFEAWYQHHHGDRDVYALDESGEYADKQVQGAFNVWQARAVLQSQSMPPEISRDLLGKIVDEVFDGAIEDAGVIEDIYRVIARETALQSQDKEDAERYRWLRDEAGLMVLPYDDHGLGPEFPGGSDLDKAIDHARRAREGG